MFVQIFSESLNRFTTNLVWWGTNVSQIAFQNNSPDVILCGWLGSEHQQSN